MRDTSIHGLSDDTRFRLAYEAMVVIAQAIFLARGIYRTGSTGSRYYAIERLEYTIGESRERLSLLNVFAKKSHLCQTEIEGAISSEEVTAMLKEAR